jgi:cysteine-rich repeat protein
MDANFICQEICGDGVIVNAECDDANVFSGDGCSSSCTLEPGFDCNLAVAPTKCKSQSMLFYKIEKITKSPDSNSATLRLHLPLLGSYPFSLLS